MSLVLIIYLYSINRAICRPSDHSVMRPPRPEIRTRADPVPGNLTTRPPHLTVFLLEQGCFLLKGFLLLEVVLLLMFRIRINSIWIRILPQLEKVSIRWPITGRIFYSAKISSCTTKMFVFPHYNFWLSTN